LIEVELGRMHHRLLGGDRGLRHRLGLGALVEACSVMVLLVQQGWPPRSRSASVKARLARAWARLARICSSAISNGLRSMVKSGSPFFTSWPSLK
jgi:hypothetical protein